MNADVPVSSRRGAAGLLDSAFRSPLLVLILQAVAFWNVWQWMGTRFVQSGEAFWGTIPLLSVALLTWLRPYSQMPDGPIVPLFAASFLFLYAAGFAVAPPMVRAVFAFASLTLVISSWRFGTYFHSGIFVLCLMSLPLTESLNFYLGYPVRVVVGEAVAYLLNLQGLDVYRDGVSLYFRERSIWIDAPCSGVKMLWFATFLAAFLSTLSNIGTLRLFVVLTFSLGAVMLGNILRASALFYTEAGLIEAGDWMHSGIGVVAFVFTSLLIVLIVRAFARNIWQK